MRVGSERDRPFFIEIRHSQSQDTYNISFLDCFYEIKKHIFARRIKTNASDLSELFLDTDVPVDFLYLNDYQNPCLLEEVFRVCVRRTTLKSVFVVHGICYSKEMRAFWKRLQADERVGITFDLYDIGLLFFDKTKIKQHYIVNF